MPKTATKKQNTTQICESLRSEIISGQFRPGEALPTQRELGERFGVGEGTASMAMSRLAHEGLIVRVRRRGSFVAQQLPQMHKTIDIVRTRSARGRQERASTLEWIESFSHFCQRQGWTARFHHHPADEIENIETLVENFSHSRGVIVDHRVWPEFTWLLERRNVPVVAVLPGAPSPLVPATYPQITYDRRASARIAVEHLAALGYRQIAFVGLASSPHRTTGFLDAIGKYQLTVPATWLLQAENSEQNMRPQVRDILQGQPCPEAFCCATDSIAEMVETVAMDLGLSIPQDLAVMACTTGSSATEAPVPISTVSFSSDEIFSRAIELIEESAPNAESKRDYLIDPIMMPLHTVIRESCGAKMKQKARE